MVASVLILCLGMAALLGGFLVINSILVFNSVRYMAVAPSMLWRDTEYVRNLPSLLMCLRDAGFASPWPPRPTALATCLFRNKLRGILEGAIPNAGRLAQQHLSLWAFVQLHRDELQQVIGKRQKQRASHILAESLDANVRGRALVFLNQCKYAEVRAARRCPPPASTTDTIGWLVRLRAFDVLMREHGYHICEEIIALDRWESADDVSILEELPLGTPGPKTSALSTQGG